MSHALSQDRLSSTSTFHGSGNSPIEPFPNSTVHDKPPSLTKMTGGPALEAPTTNQMDKHGTGRDVEKQALHNLSEPSKSSAQNGKEDSQRWMVKWDGDDDPGDPLNMPNWRKKSVLPPRLGGTMADICHVRVMTAILAMSCACVTCCSSMASDTYAGTEQDLHVGQEVSTLSISLFVAGLGLGPRKSLYVGGLRDEG